MKWPILKDASRPVLMRLSNILVFIANLFIYQNFFALSAPAGPIADVGYARYRGNNTLPGTAAFLGIPYAEPPLGERRFRAALPLNTTRVALEAGAQVVDATQYPDFCVQGSTGSGDAGGAGSEDCLKVNIYTPAEATKDSLLPVLVYIHGGGYVYGNPRNWPFDHWVAFSPTAVIVSVYYRLDAFGFLAAPEFANPAYGDFNAGFQDQIRALQWVQKHIKAFGGDPARVTINGESAGGASVELHLVAKEPKNLFAGAIAQSVYRTPLPTPAQQAPLFAFFAAQAGCGAGDVAAQLACLRSASVSAIARAQDAAAAAAIAGGYNTFHPVVDGALITDWPTRLITRGDFADVPVIVGATTNETLSGGTDIGGALQTFFPSLTTDDVGALLQAYPESAFDPALRFQTVTGDSELRCARTIIASAASRRNRAWTYRYNQRNPTSSGPGVGHAAENWMMFQGSNTGVNGSVTFTPMTPAEDAFADELFAYWLSFVRAGDPNTHKLARSPAWPAYAPGARSRIVLQQDPGNSTTHSGSVMEIEPEDETARCMLVAGMVAHQEN